MRGVDPDHLVENDAGDMRRSPRARRAALPLRLMRPGVCDKFLEGARRCALASESVWLWAGVPTLPIPTVYPLGGASATRSEPLSPRCSRPRSAGREFRPSAAPAG